MPEAGLNGLQGNHACRLMLLRQPGSPAFLVFVCRYASRVRPLKLLVKEISKDACGNDKYCQCVKHNLHNLGEPFAVFSGHEALVLENLRLISLVIPVFTVSVHLVCFYCFCSSCSSCFFWFIDSIRRNPINVNVELQPYIFKRLNKSVYYR